MCKFFLQVRAWNTIYKQHIGVPSASEGVEVRTTKRLTITGSLFSFITWSIINITWISLILTILFIQFFSTKSSRGKNQLIILFIAILPFVISIAFLEWNFLNESPDQSWLSTFEMFSHFSFLIGFLISIKLYDLADIGQDI